MNRKNLLFLVFLFSASAHAGGGLTAGDGGHGVHCKGPSLRRHHIEFLDLFEARQNFKKGWKPSGRVDDQKWGRANYTCSYIGKARKNFAELYPDNHVLFRAFDTACWIFREIDLTDGLGMHVMSDDYGFLQAPLPKNCELVQLGRRVGKGRQERIVISQRFYSSLDMLDASALALHESMHFYFEESQSTIALRQLVAFLFADDEIRHKNRDLIIELVEKREPLDTTRFR